MCFGVYARSIAVRVTSLRALQWQTAHSHVLQSALQMSVQTQRKATREALHVQ